MDDAGSVRLRRRERRLALYALLVLLPANSTGRTDIGIRSLTSGLTLSRLKLAVTMEAMTLFLFAGTGLTLTVGILEAHRIRSDDSRER
ncbi:hypothetical protein ACFIOY_11155 [Bradyrhizobium sp. TZ2]